MIEKKRLKGKVVKVSEKSIVKGNWSNDRVACPSYQETSAAILHWQTIRMSSTPQLMFAKKENNILKMLNLTQIVFIVGLNWRKFRVNISLETEKEDFDLSTSGQL